MILTFQHFHGDMFVVALVGAGSQYAFHYQSKLAFTQRLLQRQFISVYLPLVVVGILKYDVCMRNYHVSERFVLSAFYWKQHFLDCKWGDLIQEKGLFGRLDHGNFISDGRSQSWLGKVVAGSGLTDSSRRFCHLSYPKPNTPTPFPLHTDFGAVIECNICLTLLEE